ncbi:MAG TPA: glycosyltransferase [Bradyrhizobium sp.]|nr:glycosyltransferase [Bradyrhizobium sp.]
MSTKKLLFVSPRFLFPLDQGGRIRTVNILRHLKSREKFEIVLASPAPCGAAARYADEIARACHRFISWPESAVGTLRKALLLPHALPVTVAADRSTTGAARIADEIGRGIDLVLADFPHAVPLLPAQLPPAAIFTHNVEAEIFERHATTAAGLRRRIWHDQGKKMRRFEAAALRRFDTVIAVSKRDADALSTRYGLPRVAVIDTGVDLDFFSVTPEPPDNPGEAGGMAVFSGAMDSRSNIDGVRFLLREVWPLVVRRRPEARALIVGRNPPADLVNEAVARGYAWEFTGYVEDVRTHTARGHVFVIPLRVGSGTRIKAFEAMAAGRAVVSTALGIEGLDVEPGTHFLQADQPLDFAEAMLRLLNDGALRRKFATAARARVEERFSWGRVARQFEDILFATIQRPGRVETGSLTGKRGAHDQ